MSSRDAILDAIRAAHVPAAAPARPVHLPEPDGAGFNRFFAVLRAVGGEGAVRRIDQTLDEVIAAHRDARREPVTVIRGRFAVAECGAVYVDADDLADRADVVRDEHLVVTVPMDNLVETMHDAVRRIPVGTRCGWFLSGPSKTADIEQELVIGAQGARTLLVVFDPS